MEDSQGVHAGSRAAAARASSPRNEVSTRSDLVLSASRGIMTRLLLPTAASPTLHLGSMPSEATGNQAFSDISQGRHAPTTLREPAPPAGIAPWLIAFAG